MTPLSRLDPETGGSSWFRGAVAVSEGVHGIKKTDGVIDLMCDLESEGNRKCEKQQKLEGPSEEGGE